ncbi:hypothetical protein [Sphingopyxis sp. MSC1_008]|uniref:hypothetical protein n=1 Tax=Sphingopyxis sp. MSC1_008 TaxID=2909265 RepID=UPI0020BEF118|nr:hypothetical protein [Sphingopyxis sp. MSC1_008]
MTHDKAVNWKRSAMRMLVGAFIGGAAMAAVLAVAGSDLLDAMGPSRLALGAVGVVYALMAALVGFGLAAPRAGAALLNVGDADELRDERRGMIRSTVTMAAIGLVLVLLALARGPGFAAGPVPPGVAMGLLLVAFSGGAIASWRWRNDFDELNHQLGLEGCFWAFCLSWALLTLWGAADFLGWGVTLMPIDVVTTLSAMMLIGAFVAIGRRGMMTR